MSDLKGKTLFITGASRGIGLAIAKRAAIDGANIAIAAKTAEPHPKLPGTIYSAAEEIIAAGGQALPLVVDVRYEDQVESAMKKTVERFGGIDILVNNASAINLSGTESVTMKAYDLMHNINTRGTFMCSKLAVPFLRKAENAHVLNLSSPLNMETRWFQNHVAYTMAKFGMSMCVLGMSEEFRSAGIAFNALWPRTAIATAAVGNMVGGDPIVQRSRTVEIMADAAHVILTRNSREFSGNFCVDQEVLEAEGASDFSKYRFNPELAEKDLMPDFFI
ncbi:MAG: NAD(P)-dependent oxidoreductase [Porticoccaceae bacterium]|nr:NAD(P)-dependent oxidoreductase [Porticoccaceae bacterium]|tara:strand:+ start:16413 stop:17243 length:831 start_codon:yes stop_codon:yes gene_type:complete